MTSGGGGWGHPFDRPAARVQEDVLDGLVSLARVLTDYGVVLDPQTLEVDEVETSKLRKDRRAETSRLSLCSIASLQRERSLSK